MRLASGKSKEIQEAESKCLKAPKAKKRPADVIGNAAKVMRIAVGEDSDTAPDDGKNKADRS